MSGVLIILYFQYNETWKRFYREFVRLECQSAIIDVHPAGIASFSLYEETLADGLGEAITKGFEEVQRMLHSDTDTDLCRYVLRATVVNKGISRDQNQSLERELGRILGRKQMRVKNIGSQTEIRVA